jgi:hypothetical protein
MVLFEVTIDENYFLPDFFVPLFEKRMRRTPSSRQK